MCPSRIIAFSLGTGAAKWGAIDRWRAATTKTTDEPSFDVSEAGRTDTADGRLGGGERRGAVQSRRGVCLVGRLLQQPVHVQHDGWPGWLAGGGWVVGGEAQGAYVAAAVVGRRQTSATCHLSPPATALHYAAATSQAAAAAGSRACRRAASCCLLPSPHGVDLSQRIDSSPPSFLPPSLPPFPPMNEPVHTPTPSVVRRPSSVVFVFVRMFVRMFRMHACRYRTRRRAFC